MGVLKYFVKVPFCDRTRRGKHEMKNRYHIVPAYGSGELGVLQFMRLQRVGRDLVTEQEQHGSIRRIMVQLSINLDSVFSQETGCNNKPKFFLIPDKMKLVFIIFFSRQSLFRPFHP